MQKMAHRSKKDLEILPSSLVQPGSVMHYYQDLSKAEDCTDRHWTEVVYDGRPDSKPFEVPRHWHRYQDEWWEVLEGSVQIYSDGETFVMSAGDPVRTSPRRTVHSVKMFAGERAVLKERTTPTGKFKERFFRDLLEKPEPGFRHSMRASKDSDTYPDLGLGIQWLDELFILIFGTLPRLFVSANQHGNTNPIYEQHEKTA